MIRIVCPFCHAPLGVNELEKATVDGRDCLVCPEFSSVLITVNDSVDDHPVIQNEAAADAWDSDRFPCSAAGCHIGRIDIDTPNVK